MLLEPQTDKAALDGFRAANPDLFKKDDWLLAAHLGIVLSVLGILTYVVIATPYLWLKTVLGALNVLPWFALINVTIHHHHTHRNTALHPWARRLLDFLYLIVLPNAPKRLSRYRLAHLNHHAQPFHETDVDHHYGKRRYLAMSKNLWTKFLYFAELTFVGAHMPGWEDDHYMNNVPLEDWNPADYERVKAVEIKKSRRLSALQWTGFGILVWIFPPAAWGWAFPMLLVKNWAHYLGQFQHYDERFLDPARSVWNRTKTYRVPCWLNYFVGGEIAGHFVHHLFPEIPYYRVETARRRIFADPKLASFITY